MIKTNKSKKLGNFIIILGFVLIFIAIFNFNIKLRITSMFLGLIFLILGILMSLHHTEKQKKSNPDLPPSKIYFLENNNKFIKILVFIAPIILFIIITRNLNLHILNFLMLLIIISFASWYFSRYIENNKQKMLVMEAAVKFIKKDLGNDDASSLDPIIQTPIRELLTDENNCVLLNMHNPSKRGDIYFGGPKDSRGLNPIQVGGAYVSAGLFYKTT